MFGVPEGNEGEYRGRGVKRKKGIVSVYYIQYIMNEYQEVLVAHYKLCCGVCVLTVGVL